LTSSVLSGLPPMPQSPLATPLYDDPGHRAHVLAFDRDHRVSEALDDLAFLVGREDVLDELDVDEWHRFSWWLDWLAARSPPRRDKRLCRVVDMK
jgi:hypothetical protein